MHGRKQKDREAARHESSEVKAKREAKFAKLRLLLERALEARKAHDVSDATMELCGELLCLNPSLSTLWSLRREGLLSRVREGEEVASCVEKELQLSEITLKKGNVKSHEAWSHRRWIIETLAERGKTADLKRELQLCDQLLQADERNFHCFQYRRKVAELSRHSPEDDLKFAEKLVERNFSNYSGWNLKIQALKELPELLTLERIQEELGLANNAMYTEPDDSSAWMYHRWLVSNLKVHQSDTAESNEKKAQLLEDQFKTISELNEMENGDCKWALLALIRILDLAKGGGHADLAARLDPHIYPSEVCGKLKRIDPIHRNYYDWMEAKFL